VGWDRPRRSSNGRSARQRRSLHPAGRRSHDKRCPSGSGRGKNSLPSPARVMASKRRRQAKAWRSLTRETSAGVVNAHALGFDPVRARLLFRPQGVIGAGATMLPVLGGTIPGQPGVAGGAKATPGSQASARASARWSCSCARDEGQAVSWWCSRVVLVAEVDERRLVHGREVSGLAPWPVRVHAGELRG